MSDVGTGGRPSRAMIVAAFAAVYVIWGSTYLAIRFAIETLPPLLMAGIRFVIAGAMLYAWMRVRGARRPTRSEWLGATVVGALLLLGGNGLVVWSEQRVPLGPWHFPEDQLTDLTLAITAAEVTREKLFLRIHEEIPYNATVETEKFTINKDGSYRIDQVVYVTRDTHKKIVLGAGGQTIKAIGAESRKELMEIFETPVHLFLFVKVREKWSEDPERYREMGLEWTK